MISKNNFNNSFYDLNIFLASIIIVVCKWSVSFLTFENETLINKILFDIEDFYYFAYLFNVVNLDFSPDYLEGVSSNSFLPVPIYSLLFHAIFYKLIGFSSFFLLEFVFLYIFLMILMKILNQIKIYYFLALFTSLFIFLLPFLLSDISILNINLNVVSGLFSFRFPRPLVTSCYFFWGIYLAFKYFQKDNLYLKDFLFIGTCLGLTFVSYYYNFVNLFVLFFIIFIIKIITDKSHLKRNYVNILISILLFIILVSPFLLLYVYSTNDFSEMMGVITLNFEYKIKLLIHFLKKIFSLKFLSVFFIITLSTYFLLKIRVTSDKKIVKFFYFIFLSTIISPLFFVIISPSISEIHNFLNWIIIMALFVMAIYASLFINYLIERSKFSFIKNKDLFFYISSLTVIIIYQIINFENFNRLDNKDLRLDYLRLQTLMDENDSQLNNLLSFSPKIQVLWILKNKKKLSTVESAISSLEFSYLEKSLIQNFKFLNISEKDFSQIISNKKSSWRYNNEFVRYFSWYKYQANSLITYKNSNDFSNDEINFIEKASPTRTQQIIIPKFEMNRLIDLFNKFELDSTFQKPDLIVLRGNSLINDYSRIDDNLYCEIKDFNNLNVYVLKNFDICR